MSIHFCFLSPVVSELTHLIGIILQELKSMTNAFLSYFPFLPLSIWLCPRQRFSNVCVCVCLLCGLGPDVFLISVDERAKHDQQFHSLSPTAGGFITGNSLTVSLLPLYNIFTVVIFCFSVSHLKRFFFFKFAGRFHFT